MLACNMYNISCNVYTIYYYSIILLTYMFYIYTHTHTIRKYFKIYRAYKNKTRKHDQGTSCKI